MAGSEKRQRQNVVRVRLNDNERAEILTRADKAGLSVAGYLRSAVLQTPPPRQSRRPSVNHQELARVLAQLGKIGSNVNQMARVANCGGWPGYNRINEARQEIHEIRDLVMKALGVTPYKEREKKTP